MKVRIKNQSISLTDNDILGIGGEATCYKVGRSVIKIYHKEHLTSERIQKLKDYPKNLPVNVLIPKEIVFNSNSKPIGFMMNRVYNAVELSYLSNRNYRNKKNVPQKHVQRIFEDFHMTLFNIHAKNVVIGDLNDLNILYKDTNTYFIDADSFQFGAYPCVVGTEHFIDPKLIGKDLTKSVLYSPDTDWYSFCVMYLKSILFVTPFGGVLKGYNTYVARAKERKSIFGKGVKIPKSTLPFNILPDNLLDYFYKVFEKDMRGKFPLGMIHNIEWTKCQSCGLEYAGNVCPCGEAKVVDMTPVKPTVVNKTCTQEVLVKTIGNVLFARLAPDLHYVSRDISGLIQNNIGGQYPFKTSNFDFCKKRAVHTTEDHVLHVGHHPKIMVDSFNQKPLFGCSSNYIYSLNNGSLYRLKPGDNNSEMLGQAVQERTWISVGKHLGLGLYRLSEETTKYFIFGDDSKGIEYIEFPSLRGRIVDMECISDADNIALLFISSDKGKKVTHIYHYSLKTKITQFYSSTDLPHLKVFEGIHGKVLSRYKFISPTDEGLTLTLLDPGQSLGEKILSDTEPFVKSGDTLLSDHDGIYVVSENQIAKLTLK